MTLAACSFLACSNDQGFQTVTPKNQVGELTITGRACDAQFDTWVEGANVYTHLIDYTGRIYKTIESISDDQGYWSLSDLAPEEEYTIYVQHGTTLLSSFNVYLGVESITLEDPACSPPDDFKAAVVTGDYDKFGKVLTQLGIENYDVINGKTGNSLVQFLSSEVALRQYSVIFFPGGHLEEDIIYDTDGSDIDGVVPTVLQSLSNYVDAGGVIYASDWSYDVVERVWPDAIDFYGDDTIPDAAQVGIEAEVNASIEDNTMSTALGFDSVDVSFDLDSWPVMESIGGDSYVYLQADAPYRVGMETNEIDDAPIMVGFEFGEGKVVYSSWRQYSNLTGDAKDVIDAAIKLTTNP
jgi:hypothetical protein